MRKQPLENVIRICFITQIQVGTYIQSILPSFSATVPFGICSFTDVITSRMQMPEIGNDMSGGAKISISAQKQQKVSAKTYRTTIAIDLFAL